MQVAVLLRLQMVVQPSPKMSRGQKIGLENKEEKALLP
jgi:hypothetical protein